MAVYTNSNPITRLMTRSYLAKKVRKITPEQKSGPGRRLGVAYELPDGSVVYVPEEAGTPAGADQR